jgi:hemerythrin-like domain-containing protein
VTDPIALWHAEHANFMRLLDVLEKQVAAFHDAEEPDYELMLDIVSYLRDEPDRFHHPREDVMFAQLALRDPALRIPINRLLQEHRVIAVAGEELRARLEQVVAGTLMPRASLEASAAVYLAYYRHHLASQERDILPRAEGALTPLDWQMIAHVIEPGPDPLFGPVPRERYRALRERLDANSAARDAHSGKCGSATLLEPPRGAGRAGPDLGAQNE